MRLFVWATVLSLFLVSAAQAREEQTTYFGVYLKDAKLGNVTLTRDDSTERDGRPAVRTASTMRLILSVLGKGNELSTTTTTWSDRSTGQPIAVEVKTEAAGRTTKVWANFEPRAVRFKAEIQGTLKEGRFDLAPGEVFLSEASAGLPTKPEAGKKRTGKVFLADSLQLIDSEQQVEGPTAMTLGKTALLAYKLTEKNPLNPATYYLGESGELLTAQVALGMELRREEREAALAMPTGPLPELSALLACTPTGVPLTETHRLRDITYELEGVTRPLPNSDGIQQVTRNGTTVRVSISSGGLPITGSRLFPTPDAAPESLRRFLQSTAYIGSDSPEFRALARAILGSEKDAARAAAKLSQFVHESIKPDSSIPALRTAHDVNKDRRGVCRDYTTFFTAIARAAGLPTRQCVGLAYVNGLFVYHAWPEVWVGEDRWVALEPTWGEPFADATHIKLAEGELTDIFLVAADMGRYRIKVVSAR
ncbi:MAG: transglutaminase-like domain-containing protein [Armatimonas sp.]